MATKKKAATKKKGYANDHVFWMVIAFAVLSGIFFALACYQYA